MDTALAQLLSQLPDLTDTELDLLSERINELKKTRKQAETGYYEYRFIKRGKKEYGPYKHYRKLVNGKLIDEYLGKASLAEYEQHRLSVEQKRTATA